MRLQEGTVFASVLFRSGDDFYRLTIRTKILNPATRPIAMAMIRNIRNTSQLGRTQWLPRGQPQGSRWLSGTSARRTKASANDTREKIKRVQIVPISASPLLIINRGDGHNRERSPGR